MQHRGIKINCVYDQGYFGVAQGTTKQLTCHQTHALDETLRSKAVTHLDFKIKINHPKIAVSSFDDEKIVNISGIMSAQYVLGIDVGTTSVKVNLIDIATKKAIARQTKDTRADCPSELGPAAGNKQVRTAGDSRL